MKKVLALLAVGALAVTASADLTQFSWVTSDSVVDSGGVTLSTGGAYVLSLIDDDGTADVLSYVSGLQINIFDLQSFAEVASSSITVAAAGPVAGKWSSDLVEGTGSWAGKYVYAIITDADSIANIEVGDYIGISAVAGPLTELQEDAGLPQSAAQAFNGGAVSVNVEVVPEPATFGLMGVAGLGIFLARRKAGRS